MEWRSRREACSPPAVSGPDAFDSMTGGSAMRRRREGTHAHGVIEFDYNLLFRPRTSTCEAERRSRCALLGVKIRTDRGLDLDRAGGRCSKLVGHQEKVVSIGDRCCGQGNYCRRPENDPSHVSLPILRHSRSSIRSICAISRFWDSMIPFGLKQISRISWSRIDARLHMVIAPE